MRPSSSKVAVSIPSVLLRAVEAARRKSGQRRSAVVQDALRLWIKRQAEALLVREYEAGYRRKPESRPDVEAAQAAALLALSEQKW
jgi:hypothetical protein